MVKSNNNNKFLFKMIILVIVVIINIIALIGVFITVGQTIKNLKENLAEGKINKNISQVQVNNSINKQQNNNSVNNSAIEDDSDLDMELNIDTSNIMKAVMKDKNAMKSIILMGIALVLLALAVFVLIKLK